MSKHPRVTTATLLAALAALACLAAPRPVLAQRPIADVPGLRVIDPRLAAALDRLAEASPSAAAVLRDLAASGLSVAIGTPAELAALPDSEGGPTPDEEDALLAQAGSDPGAGAEPSVAWMVFRVAGPSPDGGLEAMGRVERAWVAVRVDSVAGWIHRAGLADADRLIEDDLLVILAHEFVAHVGSIARSRRLEDFCDDPVLGEGTGELACSLRVENRVRRELNRGLGLTGDRRLPQRRSYALDVMNFARAREKR